ncbi:MAG: aminotransferase class I/II-fold pyridoxal phosphate-dependent enzyme [Defluviitaleaceae bacterium]|nr:aminotransferase class I/II-fold pyridoxal phosphate-dependent enzyme [Defluviitaleaceae bacterium]
MIRFECDYAEGANPKILENLISTNLEQHVGYSKDSHCENARHLIKQICKNDNIDVHFMVGGTIANLTVISSILAPYQGVISADTGHINTHETGAIEATGHKVLTIPSSNGKLETAKVLEMLETHANDTNAEHCVQPGMVYISHPTECGTTYTKAELTALYEICQKYNIPLFIDGARLGYALVSENNDLSLQDITNLSDVFYIGATKIGALFGEAVVITNDKYKKNFRYMMKQKGGLLAKGRFLGIQFETLFENGENGLYFEMANHAVGLAMKIRKACEEKGYKMLFDSKTNQQFPILPKEKIANLHEKFAFYEWLAVDANNSAVRFCTSWATSQEQVDELIKNL